jgi:hypothetical protein
MQSGVEDGRKNCPRRAGLKNLDHADFEHVWTDDGYGTMVLTCLCICTSVQREAGTDRQVGHPPRGSS